MTPIAQIIQTRFQEAQARSPGFSQRAFAKKIGLSSGALSEILSGKRIPSHRVEAKIISALPLTPSEKRRLGISTPTSNAEFILQSDTFRLISDWWNFGILNLVRISGFKASSNFIANRLGIPVSTAHEALQLLFRLNLLVKTEKGQVKRSHESIKTSDGTFDSAIQKSHRIDLSLAEQSLTLDPTLRDLTSCTFTLRLKDLPKLKALIRKFQDELMEEAEAVPGEEVFRFTTGLFPLTKISKKEKL